MGSLEQQGKKTEGNEYGLLFGSHEMPGSWVKNIKHPMIYICRDGRDVAYSIWKTPNFKNIEQKNIPFSEFLRTNIDWVGTPSHKSYPKENIIQHWERHVTNWSKVKKKNLLIIRYEDLVLDPQKEYRRILKKFFPLRYFLTKNGWIRENIEIVKKPIGLKPNNAKPNNWQTKYTKEDQNFFLSQIREEKFLY